MNKDIKKSRTSQKIREIHNQTLGASYSSLAFYVARIRFRFKKKKGFRIFVSQHIDFFMDSRVLLCRL